MLTLTFEANIKDSLPKWDRATPINKKNEIFLHGIAQMDRSWMNESRISPEYEDGVEQFLQFASERGRPNEEGKYYCPCINCLNGR